MFCVVCDCVFELSWLLFDVDLLVYLFDDGGYLCL